MTVHRNEAEQETWPELFNSLISSLDLSPSSFLYLCFCAVVYLYVTPAPIIATPLLGYRPTAHLLFVTVCQWGISLFYDCLSTFLGFYANMQNLTIFACCVKFLESRQPELSRELSHVCLRSHNNQPTIIFVITK